MDLTNLVQKQQAAAQQQSYSKEEYAAMKKAEREQTWARVDALAEDAFSAPDKLRGILDFIACCTPQNTATLLLLHDQNPDITMPKTVEEWRREGRVPRVFGEGYTALLRQSYAREPGKTASGYNVGKVYDVSQVRGRPVPPPAHYEPEELVAAMIATSPVPVQLADNLPENVPAQYVPAQRTIFVRNNMDTATTVCALAREQAQAGFDTDRSYRRQTFAAQSYCAAYIVARKYGLETGGFQMEPILSACAGLDAEGKRNFLSDAKGAAYKVERNMEQSLNARQAEIVQDPFDITVPAPAQPAHEQAQPKPKARGGKDAAERA